MNEQEGQSFGAVNVENAQSLESNATTRNHAVVLLRGLAKLVDMTPANEYVEIHDTDLCQTDALLLKYCNLSQQQVPLAFLRSPFFPRHPFAPDEVFKVINMLTGKTLRVGYSQINNIVNDSENGDVIDEVIDVASVNTVVEDPITAITLPQEQTIMQTNLGHYEQLERVEMLAHVTIAFGDDDNTLKDPVYTRDWEEVAVNFLPESEQELKRFLSSVDPPLANMFLKQVIIKDDLRLTIDLAQHKHFTRTISNLSCLDNTIQQHIIDHIDRIAIPAHFSDYDRTSPIVQLLRSAIDAKSYQPTPRLALISRLDVSVHDLMIGFYGASDGRLYYQSKTSVYGDPIERLDEQKAQAYIKHCGKQLMPIVEDAREVFAIPVDLPPEEQMMMLLKNGMHYGAGHGLSKQLGQKHPKMGALEWTEVCAIIERSTKQGEVTAKDASKLHTYRLSVKVLEECLSGEYLPYEVAQKL